MQVGQGDGSSGLFRLKGKKGKGEWRTTVSTTDGVASKSLTDSIPLKKRGEVDKKTRSGGRDIVPS